MTNQHFCYAASSCFYLHTRTEVHTYMKSPCCWVSPRRLVSTVVPSLLPRRLTACSSRWVWRCRRLPAWQWSSRSGDHVLKKRRNCQLAQSQTWNNTGHQCQYGITFPFLLYSVKCLVFSLLIPDGIPHPPSLPLCLSSLCSVWLCY